MEMNDFYGKAETLYRIGVCMKRKKLSTLLALVLGVTALSGCTNSDQKVNFGNFWVTDVLNTNAAIQETLSYDVTFNKGENSLVNYEIDYKDGTYTTALVGAKENDKIVYTYTTTLNITAVYTFNGETKECTDVVTSTVKFYAAEYGLQPISTEKDVNGSAPTAASATALEDCYEQFHYTTKVIYNEDCTSGTTTVTQHLTTGETKAKDSSFEIDQDKFSFLDNEQILFALRGIRNSTTSAKMNVYNPFVASVQKVSVTVNAEASESFSFYKNGSAEKEAYTITYRPMNLVLDEKNPGAMQTAWIAKTIDASKNTHRNVMLQLETPLSYGLGTLVYKLNSVSYQEM